MASRIEVWRPLGNNLQRRSRPPTVGSFSGEPNASNTGLAVLGLSTSDLTVVNGDLTISNAYVAANGSTIDRLWVKGHLLFTATSPVVVTNSLIQGRTFSGAAPYESIVRARNGSAPVTATVSFRNCKLMVIQPDVGISTAAGERLGFFDRCDISGGSDLIDYWNPSSPQVYNSYLHDYSFFQNDPKHTTDSRKPGWSHNDLIQNSGSDGGLIYGNSFDCRAAPGVGDVAVLIAGGYPNRNWGTSVTLTPGNHITNIVVRDNWFRFSECHLFLSQQNGANDTGNSMKVYGNQLDTNVHGYGPYTGLYSRQLIRWHALEGPLPADVYNNSFINDSSVISSLRGTDLPAPSLIGGATSSGQYIISINTVDVG